jgi:hypothetical protein
MHLLYRDFLALHKFNNQSINQNFLRDVVIKILPFKRRWGKSGVPVIMVRQTSAKQ